MNDDEQFFSPQALRLLGADNETDLPASQELLCLFADHSSVMQPHQQRRQPSKPRSVARGLPGTSTFCIASDAERKPKRAKFEPERRKEVAYIRKRGACLRCRIMKLGCSGEMPCKACARSSNTCRAREPKYPWMHCVPFSLKEVDIFATYLSISEDVYNEILFRNDRFLTEKVQLFDAGCVIDSLNVEFTALDFTIRILWDKFNRESSSQVAGSSMSRIGLISSAQIQLLISNILGNDFSESLRILVETSSLLYNSSTEIYAGYDLTDLQILQSFSGTRVLHHLERALSVKVLARARSEVLQSLFIALTGTIMSISYMREGLTSYLYTSNGSLLNAKEHLLNVLTHYLVYIAERLAFARNDAAKAALIRKAHSPWDHQPQYQWVERDDLITTRRTTNTLRCPTVASPCYMADKAVLSRCTSCGVRRSVELLSNHDGCCEACSVSHGLDLKWPAIEDVVSAGEALHRTDSQTAGIWSPQGSIVDQANEPIHKVLDTSSSAVLSRDNVIAQGVLDHRLNGEVTSKTPEAWRYPGFTEIVPDASGVGQNTTSERISQQTSPKFDMRSTLGPSTDNNILLPPALRIVRYCQWSEIRRTLNLARAALGTREILVLDESVFDDSYPVRAPLPVM